MNNTGSINLSSSLVLLACATGPGAQEESTSVQLEQITASDDYDGDVDWSPDGEWLAFASHRSGNYDIWIKKVAGGDPIRVTRDSSRESMPRWAPDSKTLLFMSNRGDAANIWTTAPFGDVRPEKSDCRCRFGHVWHRELVT